MRRAVPSTATPSVQSAFRLYVEGPRDRGLVETWSKTRSRELARWVARETVILGGSQPQRAAEDFAARRGQRDGFAALCLLDRDQGELALESCHRDGLEFFVWPRRHIESYLLVPAAIRRCLRLKSRDRSVEDFFAREAPPLGDEHALRDFDAKALFGARGAIAERFGRSVSSAQVARAMRADELHPDVARFLDRLADGVGLGRAPTAVRKPVARRG